MRSAWTQSDPIERGSNTGTLVRLYAPGAHLRIWDPGISQLYPDSTLAGTSLAAPFVAGVAALMKSFDPRLTADSLKALLLQGADNGGWKSGDTPFLNARESLKLAGQHTGAPLCGNRVWRSGAAMRTLRNGVEATLFSVPAASFISDLEVLHGGKGLRYYDRTTRRNHLASWSAGVWSDITISATDSSFAFSAPSYVSWTGVSHDLDSMSYVLPNGGFSHTIYVGSTVSGAERPLATVNLDGPQTGGDECIRRYHGGTHDGECLVDMVGSTRSYNTISQPAYSPRGIEIYVGQNSWTDRVVIDANWIRCPGYDAELFPDEYEECKGYARTSQSTQGNIFAYDRRTGLKRTVATQGGVAFTDVSAADGGNAEISVQAHAVNHFEHYSWQLPYNLPKLDANTPGQTCTTEYRRLDNGNVQFTAGPCGVADVTFSAFRAAMPAVRRRR